MLSELTYLLPHPTPVSLLRGKIDPKFPPKNLLVDLVRRVPYTKPIETLYDFPFLSCDITHFGP